MSRLCTICARAGSKGVPGKNVRELAAKPLIAHSIEQAKASGLFAVIAVSSDSSLILDAAAQYGADLLVRRPVAMATDDAPKLPAIRHCVEAAEREFRTTFQIVVDLGATGPLRSPADIIGAVELLECSGATSVITGSPARCSPYYSQVELDHRGRVQLCKPPAAPIVRRQDAPLTYDMNGSIYVWRRDVFMNNPMVFYDDTLLFEMPPERSVDIDSEFDWQIAVMLMRQGARLVG